MNDIIDDLMTFINENTTILIIICVFLIVLLVIYLIDNAIKASSISKNSNIAKKEAKEKAKEVKEEVVVKEDKKDNIFEDAIVSDSPKVEDIFNETPVDTIEEEIVDIDEIVNKPNEDDKSVDVIYKNDKKLSDILFGEINNQPSGKLDESITKKDDNIQKLEDTSDELDKIMEKLNKYHSQTEIIDDEDNFTNMF